MAASNTQTVGGVKYDASIDLAALRSSIAQADKLVAKSYQTQTKNAQKASKQTTEVSSKDAQARVNAVTKEAQDTLRTISSYAPQVQRQYLTVERANNAVTTATLNAQKAVQKYGEGSTQAQVASSRLSTAVQNQGIQQEKLNRLMDGSTDSTGRFSSSLKTAGAVAGATAAIVGTVLNKALNSISSSIGSAVQRVDTLNNSSRTFENMGIATSDSKKAMDELQKSIKGLPTPLDSAVSGMTSLTATYGDINKGQKVFSALNNAILGFGGSSAMVDNAITQLSQLPLDGPLDAQTWNSLRNSGITPVLAAMAKDSKVSVAEMKEQFGSGELKVQDFIDRLLKLNKDGGGGLKSLEKIAKDSTKGVGTGFANMQTAITRGLASIIDTIGSENISGAINTIGLAFETALKTVSGLINFLKDNKDVFAPIAFGIGTVVSAFVAWNLATTAWSTVTKAATAAQLAFNTALRANPIGLVITAVAALVAGLIYFFTQTETGQKIMQSFFRFISDSFKNIVKWASNTWSKVTEIFSNAWNNIKNVFSNIGGFFSGVWDKVTRIFKQVGTTIGNAIGGAFKSAINGAISLVESGLNTPVRLINGAIGAINKLPGVEVGKIPELKLPRFADGGYVGAGGKHQAKGIVEGGEYVLPREQVNQTTGMPKPGAAGTTTVNVTLNMSGIMTSSKADERAIATRFAKLINEAVKSKTGNTAIVGV